MPRVALHFDEQFNETIGKLFDEKDSETGDRLFPTLVDLMVFCAMVGRDSFDDCDGVRVNSKGREISSEVFQSQNKAGIAYLLALDHKQDGNILREESDKEMWEYIQNFAFLGLQQIEKWMNASGNLNIDPKNIILDKMKEIALRDGLHKA
jgi:dnd system-associated protein 4